MTQKNFSRRDFLKVAGLTVGASSLLCCGGAYAATLAPVPATPEMTYGENNVNNKILLVYATRAGSTAEISQAIAESLSGRGFTVDVKNAKSKPNPAGYQGVIVGSAIRMGAWVPEAVDFVKNNQAALAQVPVALFTVHMQNTGADETSTTARLAYLDAVRPLVKATQEVYFTGKLDMSTLSIFDRFVTKMVKGVEADNRDWNKIRTFGETVFA